jgi:DNA-binding transcriptional MerR regulator
MTVHDLAKRVGVAAHVVRYYTQRGLLHPRRNARNGYREYARSDFHRLQFICRAKLVGFTLSDIQLILRDADAGVAPCLQVRRLVQRRAKENDERLAAAERLQRRIRAAVDSWETIPDQPPDHESLCRLIDAIALDEGDDEATTGYDGLSADVQR